MQTISSGKCLGYPLHDELRAIRKIDGKRSVFPTGRKLFLKASRKFKAFITEILSSQLAGYLGIPVISWNADNSGLERRASQSTLQLQLAPSIEHQAAAMLSILERYKWHQFSVVTSQIAGHDDFVQAVREHVVDMQDRFKFTILNSIIVTRSSDLVDLVNSEARVMLLYCTKSEAIEILKG